MMHTQLRTLLKQTSALTSIAAIGVFLGQPVLANPLGGDVVSGAATISATDPSTTLIDQSTDRAVINWDSFNIDAGETTQFDLPSADSWTLNRVVGSQSPSIIQGSIISNGNIVIVNPDGMHFGSGSTVDVNRLIASTADITNDNFMAGQLEFGIAGNPSASIVNEGVISAADYGLAALVAPSVRNSGVIMARLGTVGLSAGNSFTIDPYGDGLIKLAIGDEIAGEVFHVATGEAVSDLVLNEGTLSADGGTVAMTAATARQAVNSVVNNTGIVEARSVGLQNGMIVLGGSTAATKPTEAPAQVVRVSGTLDASGNDDLYPLGTPVEGGKIQITGEVILGNEATIDASGANGGGTVLVGGDYLGGNIAAQDALALGVELEDRQIDTASLVVLHDTVRITADATEAGDGGKIIVWSDGRTATAAEIMARGGAEAGDGGFIETSGGILDVRNAADASAINGEAGTWLIDPYDIRISSTSNGLQDSAIFEDVLIPSDLRDLQENPEDYSFDGEVFFPVSEESVLDVSVIEGALNDGTSVVVSTVGAPGGGAGNITLDADVRKTAGGTAVFVLDAAGDIEVESGVDITSTSGALWVALQAFDGAISANNIGEIELNGGGLALIAEDNILLSSNFDMPNLAIEVLPDGGGARAVAIEFDDDQIAFGFNDQTIVVPTGGISLTDTTADGLLSIDTGDSNQNLGLVLSNLSLVDQFGRFRFIDINGSIGVLESDHLDGTPEIVFGVDQYDLLSQLPAGEDYLYSVNDEPGSGTEPGAGVVPVAEISLDFNETVDFYEVSAPSGRAIVEAYLASLNPPVEPPVPPVEPPTTPEPEMEVPTTQEILNPDLFIGPVQNTDTDGSNSLPEPILSTPPVPYEVSELERAHGALSNARSLREALSLAKDLAESFAAYLRVANYSQLAAQSEYFRLQLGYATLESWQLAGDIGAGIYIEYVIERPLAENLSDYMESNQAEAIANMMGAGVEAAVTGGITLPFYIFDQATLVQEAALEVRGSFNDAQSATFKLLTSTVDIRDMGYLSTDEGLEAVQLSRSTIADVPWSPLDQAKMEILHDLVEIKLTKSPIGESLLLEGEVVSYSRAMTQRSGFDLVAYANEVASELEIKNWPEPDSVAACINGCQAIELYR